MDDSKIKSILDASHKIAIIGAKDTEGQPVDRVGRYLLSKNFEVYPIHPARSTVWGLDAYKSIGDLKIVPDIVVLFRASEFCEAHAREVLATTWRPKLFWMQLGISNDVAKKLMNDAQVDVVENLCIMVEHKRLCIP